MEIDTKHIESQPIDNLFPIEKEGKWGFIDRDWNVSIQPIYEEVDYFSDGVAAVLKGEEWGYINKNGQTIIGFNYNSASSFNEGQAWVRSNDEFLIINMKGEVIKSYSDKAIDDIFTYSSNLYLFEKDGRYGYLNSKGIIIEARYDEASSFIEGLALVTVEGQSKFINTLGEDVILNKEYTPLEIFSEGLSMVLYGKDKFAYINRDGDVIISPSRRIGSKFSEGKAFQFDPEHMKFGYINSTGEIVIPFKYDAALPFKSGLAYVKRGDKAELIDMEDNPQYSLPKDSVIDVESYLMNLDYYLIDINGDKKIVNRFSGEIRD